MAMSETLKARIEFMDSVRKNAPPEKRFLLEPTPGEAACCDYKGCTERNKRFGLDYCRSSDFVNCSHYDKDAVAKERLAALKVTDSSHAPVTEQQAHEQKREYIQRLINDSITPQ
jgi:hypothetical protein